MEPKPTSNSTPELQHPRPISPIDMRLFLENTEAKIEYAEFKNRQLLDERVTQQQKIEELKGHIKSLENTLDTVRRISGQFQEVKQLETALDQLDDRTKTSLEKDIRLLNQDLNNLEDRKAYAKQQRERINKQLDELKPTQEQPKQEKKSRFVEDLLSEPEKIAPKVIEQDKLKPTQEQPKKERKSRFAEDLPSAKAKSNTKRFSLKSVKSLFKTEKPTKSKANKPAKKELDQEIEDIQGSIELLKADIQDLQTENASYEKSKRELGRQIKDINNTTINSFDKTKKLSELNERLGKISDSGYTNQTEITSKQTKISELESELAKLELKHKPESLSIGQQQKQLKQIANQVRNRVKEKIAQEKEVSAPEHKTKTEKNTAKKASHNPLLAFTQTQTTLKKGASKQQAKRGQQQTVHNPKKRVRI